VENAMTPMTDIAALIGDALNALREQTGLEGNIEPKVRDTVAAAIAIKRGARVWHFNVEVKAWTNKTTLYLVKEQIRRMVMVGDWLLVTRYIAPRQADELRAMNLAFLDTAGNAFINREGLYGGTVTRERETYSDPLNSRCYLPSSVKKAW
jgi:hypothetical protein